MSTYTEGKSPEKQLVKWGRMQGDDGCRIFNERKWEIREAGSNTRG